MAFAEENILSAHGPQIPTIVVPQNGAPRKSITLVDPSLPDTVLNCVTALSTQDQETYADWAATGGSVRVGCRSYWTDSSPIWSATASEDDATIGTFTFQVPVSGTDDSGIYLFEAGLFNARNVLVMANAGYLEVTPSVAYQQDAKPISVARIRRAMRDAHPRNNRILEECEFPLQEIMDAISDAVDEYNSWNQPTTNYSPQNFPVPVRLMDGVVSRLLETAAIWYARNDLRVRAAGLDADDMGKANIYMQLAEIRRRRWERWMTIHKRNLNIRGGWGTVPSRSFL